MGGVAKTLKVGLTINQELSSEKQIDFWNTMLRFNVNRLQLDLSNTRFSDPNRIELDNAEINLNQAELAYYHTAQILGAYSLFGYEVLPVRSYTLIPFKQAVDKAVSSEEEARKAYLAVTDSKPSN